MRKLLLILALASTTQAADLPKYWSVHIDLPRNEDRDDYEQAAREQAILRRQILADHQIDRPPVFLIRTQDGTYLSFRPRENFAAFDATLPADVREEIKKKAGSMDDRVHATLRDHHSEIWETMKDLTVIPENSARARGYARLATMRAKPASFDDFNSVMKRFAEAVQKAHPKDVVITFFSMYGDGTFKQLWLSDEQIIGMRDTLKDAFGGEAADGLMKQWKGSIDSIHIAPARTRPDLTGTTPEEWLRY